MVNLKFEPKLDRRVPTSFEHVKKYPASALRMMQRTVQSVERRLRLPAHYHGFYDQGQEGACVGFGQSIMMSIINRRLYDPMWLYREAQDIDEWTDTPPEAGTSLSAGFDVLRTKGHRRMWSGQSRPPEIDEGIVEVNRWLSTVDEGRTALSEGKPICDGVNWYAGFYAPIRRSVKVRGRRRSEYWIPEPASWGRLRGGHCIVRTGASDEREAFEWSNSWGMVFPWPVLISYESHQKLMSEMGEQAIVTDR